MSLKNKIQFRRRKDRCRNGQIWLCLLLSYEFLRKREFIGETKSKMYIIHEASAVFSLKSSPGDEPPDVS